MRFAEKVIRQRELCGMTQQSLADAAGVSRRSVASYEASGVIPRRSTIRKIAKVLGVSYDYLYHDEIEDPLCGIEKVPALDIAAESFGDAGEQELSDILDSNLHMFAGGSISAEAREKFFLALAQVYVSIKSTAGQKHASPGQNPDSREVNGT